MPPSPMPALNLDQLPYATEAETAMFRAAFTKFDQDGSDAIDLKELRNVMDELGKEVSDKDLEQMMATADKDGAGTVDFREFCGMMGKQVADDGGGLEWM